MKSPELLSDPAALDRGNELLGLIVSSYTKFRQSGMEPDAVPGATNVRLATAYSAKRSLTQSENQQSEQRLVAAMASDRPNTWNLSYKEVLDFLHDHNDRAIAAEALPRERPFDHYLSIETLGSAHYNTRILQGFVAVKFAYLSFLIVNDVPGAVLPKYSINTFNDFEGDGRIKPIVKLAIE